MVLSKAARGRGPTLSPMRGEPNPDAQVPVIK